MRKPENEVARAKLQPVSCFPEAAISDIFCCFVLLISVLSSPSWAPGVLDYFFPACSRLHVINKGSPLGIKRLSTRWYRSDSRSDFVYLDSAQSRKKFIKRNNNLILLLRVYLSIKLVPSCNSLLPQFSRRDLKRCKERHQSLISRGSTQFLSGGELLQCRCWRVCGVIIEFEIERKFAKAT